MAGWNNNDGGYYEPDRETISNIVAKGIFWLFVTVGFCLLAHGFLWVDIGEVILGIFVLAIASMKGNHEK